MDKATNLTLHDERADKADVELVLDINCHEDDNSDIDEEGTGNGGDMTSKVFQRFKSLVQAVPRYAQAVKELNQPFKLITSLQSKGNHKLISTENPSELKPPLPTTKKILCILDSSFNPPTNAHLELALRALEKYQVGESDAVPSTLELLLLLATTNVDKEPKPADFSERLAMMTLMAKRVREQHKVNVGIGITPFARFIDKSTAISSSELYPGGTTQQVWILGYDTMVRLVDKKYYPNGDLNAVYNTLLSGNNRILMMFRPVSYEESSGDQERWLYHLDERVKSKLDLIEPSESSEGVSSTNVRTGVSSKGNQWKKYVWAELSEYITARKPFHSVDASKKAC